MFLLFEIIFRCFYRFRRKKEDCIEVSPFVYNYSNRYHKNSKSVEQSSLYCKQELNHVLNICSNKILFIIWNIMFGYIPAIMIDFVTTLFGYELRFVLLLANARKLYKCYYYIQIVMYR